MALYITPEGVGGWLHVTVAVCVSSGGLLRDCSDSTVLLYHRGFKGLPSLHSLVPSLLRHEVEKAMEKLDVIWDRTYAWDMFLDMMVRVFVCS